MSLNWHIFRTSAAILLSGCLPAFSNPPSIAGDKNVDVQSRLLTHEQAVHYAMELVNRDRAKLNLKPLLIDSIAAKAGQQHSDEMAIYGYLSHWDLSGKKPDQRYTECGGTDYSSENAGYALNRASKAPIADDVFELKANALFPSIEIEVLEKTFINEKPPYDGHRKQILDSSHNRLGIGLSLSEGRGQRRITIAQEFVNHYGEFEKIPIVLKQRAQLIITGVLPKQIEPGRVLIEVEPLPKPRTPAQLNAGPHVCTIDGLPIRDYFAGKDPEFKVWNVNGKTHFSVTVQIDDMWEKGLYYISVWTKKTGHKIAIPVSLRTALIE